MRGEEGAAIAPINSLVYLSCSLIGYWCLWLAFDQSPPGSSACPPSIPQSNRSIAQIWPAPSRWHGGDFINGFRQGNLGTVIHVTHTDSSVVSGADRERPFLACKWPFWWQRRANAWEGHWGGSAWSMGSLRLMLCGNDAVCQGVSMPWGGDWCSTCVQGVLYPLLRIAWLIQT